MHYVNATLADLPVYFQNRLQYDLNAAARLIFRDLFVRPMLGMHAMTCAGLCRLVCYL